MIECELLFPNLYILSNYYTGTIFHLNKLNAFLIFNFYAIFVAVHYVFSEPKRVEPGT
jgi:hypothetical protein